MYRIKGAFERKPYEKHLSKDIIKQVAVLMQPWLRWKKLTKRLRRTSEILVIDMAS